MAYKCISNNIVLIGEMSVVGPRLHAIELDCYCTKKYKNYRFRHLVKPGITGMAKPKVIGEKFGVILIWTIELN